MPWGVLQGQPQPARPQPYPDLHEGHGQREQRRDQPALRDHARTARSRAAPASTRTRSPARSQRVPGPSVGETVADEAGQQQRPDRTRPQRPHPSWDIASSQIVQFHGRRHAEAARPRQPATRPHPRSSRQPEAQSAWPNGAAAPMTVVGFAWFVITSCGDPATPLLLREQRRQAGERRVRHPRHLGDHGHAGPVQPAVEHGVYRRADAVAATGARKFGPAGSRVRSTRCSTTSRSASPTATASERFYDTVLAPLGIEQSHPTTTSPSGTTSRSRRPTRASATRAACTSASPRPRASRSTRSGRPGSRPATATTASPGRGRSTATTTTARSCSTPTATASRPSTTSAMRRGGGIDHLWIRVADVAASTRFYETIAPHAGLAARADTPTRALRGPTAARSRCSPGDADRARPPRVPRAGTTRRWTRSTRPRPPPATTTTARPASAALPPRLLRRLRARSRRQQRRGRQPQRRVAAMTTRIGCSGWNYADWRERVYPKGLPARRWLELLRRRFRHGRGQHHLLPAAAPRRSQRWVEQTPPDFVFAVKASRYLTHIKRLRDLGPGLAALLRADRAAGRLAEARAGALAAPGRTSSATTTGSRSARAAAARPALLRVPPSELVRAGRLRRCCARTAPRS